MVTESNVDGLSLVLVKVELIVVPRNEVVFRRKLVETVVENIAFCVNARIVWRFGNIDRVVLCTVFRIE